MSALVLDRVVREPSSPPRTRRWLILAGVTVSYLALWVVLYRGIVSSRTATGHLWAGFDAGRIENWLRLPPTLYTPLLLPPPYETWWMTPLRQWPAWYLALGVLTALVLWRVARADRLGERCVRAGLLWAVVTCLPLLGLKGLLDFSRSGYIVPIGTALIVAGVATRVRDRLGALASLTLILAVAWGWLSIDAARAWGREGFQVRNAVRWRLAEPLARRTAPARDGRVGGARSKRTATRGPGPTRTRPGPERGQLRADSIQPPPRHTSPS